MWANGVLLLEVPFERLSFRMLRAYPCQRVCVLCSYTLIEARVVQNLSKVFDQVALLGEVHQAPPDQRLY